MLNASRGNVFALINTETAVRQLVELLYSPKRKVPVVVITQRSDKEGPVISAPKLQELVGPMAKVFTLSGGVQRFFNRALANVYGIEPTGVRMYMPRMSVHDYPTKHPVWNQSKVESFPCSDDFMQMIRDYCIKRIEFQQSHTHTQKLISMEQADALFQQATPPPARRTLSPSKPVEVPTEHKTPKGRTVLHVTAPKKRRPRPSDDSIIALMRKFQK